MQRLKNLSRTAKLATLGLLLEVERRKVKESFEYFCDKYVYIEDKENKRSIKLNLWPAQREVLPDLVGAILLELLKTRQVGLTWMCAALVVWLGIKHPLFLTIIISASEDHAIEFLNRVYFILDRLPGWLVPEIKTRTKLILEFKHQDGLISTIKSMPTIEMGAESKTPNLLIIDEAHTIRNVSMIFNSSYPGIEQAKGQVIVIANSVKTGPGWGWVRDTYQKSMQGINKFKRIFLSWTAHPDRPPDFRERMVQSGMDEEDVIQHYPATEQEALASSTGSYFGKTLNRHNQTRPGVKGYLQRNKEKEVEFVQDAKGILEVWRHPYFLLEKWNGRYWERRYCMGSDISEGLGQSFSVAYVMDRDRDEMVCRLRSNRLDAVEWAEQLDMLAEYYCNHRKAEKKYENVKALICPEVTGAGQTTVKELLKKKGSQLYVKVIPDTVGSGVTKQYGWHESNQSKHELCGDLKSWFRNTRGTVYCAILLDEAQTFIRFDNGKLDHEDGKESDCVMGAGTTLQASIFMGEGPKEIKPDLTGWRARKAEEAKRNTVWAN